MIMSLSLVLCKERYVFYIVRSKFVINEAFKHRLTRNHETKIQTGYRMIEEFKEIKSVLAQVLSASNANSFRFFKRLNYTSLYA